MTSVPYEHLKYPDLMAASFKNYNHIYPFTANFYADFMSLYFMFIYCCQHYHSKMSYQSQTLAYMISLLCYLWGSWTLLIFDRALVTSLTVVRNMPCSLILYWLWNPGHADKITRERRASLHFIYSLSWF